MSEQPKPPRRDVTVGDVYLYEAGLDQGKAERDALAARVVELEHIVTERNCANWEAWQARDRAKVDRDRWREAAKRLKVKLKDVLAADAFNREGWEYDQAELLKRAKQRDALKAAVRHVFDAGFWCQKSERFRRLNLDLARERTAAVAERDRLSAELAECQHAPHNYVHKALYEAMERQLIECRQKRDAWHDVAARRREEVGQVQRELADARRRAVLHLLDAAAAGKELAEARSALTAACEDNSVVRQENDLLKRRLAECRGQLDAAHESYRNAVAAYDRDVPALQGQVEMLQQTLKASAQENARWRERDRTALSNTSTAPAEGQEERS